MGFEDLEVWQRALGLSVEIYRYFDGNKDFGFRDQITRSGLSIPSNIAEGCERNSTRDLLRFLGFAKGSSGELRTQIRSGHEIGYIDDATADHWMSEVRAVSRMLHGLMRSPP